MCAHRYYYQYAHIGITIDSLSVLLSIVYRYSERGRNHGFGRYANAPWYLQISSPHHKAQQSHYIITPEWIKLDEQRNTQKNKIINIETRQTTQHKLTKSESKQTEKKTLTSCESKAEQSNARKPGHTRCVSHNAGRASWENEPTHGAHSKIRGSMTMRTRMMGLKRPVMPLSSSGLFSLLLISL